jgi:phenylacetic acid degradation operon negative regulatory protein
MTICVISVSMTLSAKSLTLDLLATVRRGAVPVRALIGAAELFDIAENNMRVALARLSREGQVLRDERGYYRLASSAMSDRVRSWNGVGKRMCGWNGSFIVVHTAGLSRKPTPLRRRARALRLLGFRSLRSGLELRPNNLAGGADAIREELLALGLEAEALVMRADLGDADAHDAARLWENETLQKDTREMREALVKSRARLLKLPREEAMATSFTLGGSAIRLILFDPLLPAPIGDPAGLLALVNEMRAFDKLGRKLWSGWMGETNAKPQYGPADVREWRGVA